MPLFFRSVGFVSDDDGCFADIPHTLSTGMLLVQPLYVHVIRGKRASTKRNAHAVGKQAETLGESKVENRFDRFISGWRRGKYR